MPESSLSPVIVPLALNLTSTALLSFSLGWHSVLLHLYTLNVVASSGIKYPYLLSLFWNITLVGVSFIIAVVVVLWSASPSVHGIEYSFILSLSFSGNVNTLYPGTLTSSI